MALTATATREEAQARVGTSVADLFALGTDEGTRSASAARAAGSLLRNVRVMGGGGGGGAGGEQEGERGVIETELYRHCDVGACTYFTSQTADVPSGHFVFVRQGTYGALSLVIVGGRAAGGPPEDEFTILIRGC